MKHNDVQYTLVNPATLGRVQSGQNSEVAAAQKVAAAKKRSCLKSNDYFCGSVLRIMCDCALLYLSVIQSFCQTTFKTSYPAVINM